MPINFQLIAFEHMAFTMSFHPDRVPFRSARRQIVAKLEDNMNH